MWIVGCRKRRKPDDGEQSTRPEFVTAAGQPPHRPHSSSDKTLDETPPPEYCPRPANGQQTLDKSGYADLGLGYEPASRVPSDSAGETSMNRSLRRSPRRASRPPDPAAAVCYVNPSYVEDDDDAVSDRPTGSRPRSPDADRVATASNNEANRAFDDPAWRPGVPVQEVDGGSEPSGPRKKSGGSGGGGFPAGGSGTRPIDSGFPAGLLHDTAFDGSESPPPGSAPGDRSFEIVEPDSEVPELPNQPFGNLNPPAYQPPRSGPDGRSAFDRLYPPVDPRSRGGARSDENLLAPPGGARGNDRLNRSFDPSSYLSAESAPFSAAGRQGSAPDVRHGNATIQFNTAAQAIDV